MQNVFLFLGLFWLQVALADSGAYIMVREINVTNAEVAVFRIDSRGQCEGVHAKGPLTHAPEVAKLEPKRSGSPVFKLVAYFKGSVSESGTRVAFAEAQAAATNVTWTEDLSSVFDSESFQIYNPYGHGQPVKRATLVQWNDNEVTMTSLGKPTESVLALVAAAKLQRQSCQAGCWVSVQPLRIFRTTHSTEMDVLKKAGQLLPLNMENTLQTAMPSGSISLPQNHKMSDRVPVATLEVYRMGTNGIVMGSFY
jgi:hypothetical protein